MSKVKKEQNKQIILARTGKSFYKALRKCQVYVFTCLFDGSRPGVKILIVKSSHIIKLGEWITLLQD